MRIITIWLVHVTASSAVFDACFLTCAPKILPEAAHATALRAQGMHWVASSTTAISDVSPEMNGHVQERWEALMSMSGVSAAQVKPCRSNAQHAFRSEYQTKITLI